MSTIFKIGDFPPYELSTTSPYLNNNRLTFYELDYTKKLLEKSKEVPINVEYNLAGTDKEDIQVYVENNYLKIEIKNSLYKSESINDYLDKSKISAVYKNGLLKIEIPLKKIKRKNIEIK